MVSIGLHQSWALCQDGSMIMDEAEAQSRQHKQKWEKMAYGGIQPGYDETTMVMNANLVKRDLLKVMLDSISVSQYHCYLCLVLMWPSRRPSRLHVFAAMLSLFEDHSFCAAGYSL